MIGPPVADERANALHALVPASAASTWKRHGVILGLVFFWLTLLGVSALSLLFPVHVFIAMLCIALAEFLIQKKHFFGTGIELALWSAALVHFILSLPSSGKVEAILVFALAAAIVGLRMRNAFAGALASILVVAYAAAKWHSAWPAIAIALVIAIACVLALMLEWRRPSSEQLFAFTAVVMPVAGYVAALILHDGKPDLSIAATFAIAGSAILVVGIMRRDRATMITAAIMIAIASIEARDLVHESYEVKQMFAGALLVAIAAAISRALRDAKRGFVITPSSMTKYDEAMQIAGTIAMAHASPAHAEPQRESGGGNFGGAGASGTY